MRWSFGLGCYLLISFASLLNGRADELLSPDLPPEQAIDHYIDAALRQAAVNPAPSAEDTNFLRRIMLDLTGRPPMGWEARRFQSDADATKRTKLVDQLLGSPAYVRHQATEFDAWLMDGTKGSIRDYLAKAFREKIHSIGGTRALAFSNDGKLLVAGGIGTIGNIDHLDGPARVELFEVDSGQSAHVFSGETKGLIEQLLFHPAGQVLFGVGGDNGGLWQAYDLAERKTIRSEKAPMHIYAAELSEDARQLCAVGHGRIVVWEVSESSTPAAAGSSGE